MLLAGPHGHEETRVAGEGGLNPLRDQGLEMQRLTHVVIAGGVAAVAAAERLHGGGTGWVWLAGAAGLAAAWAARAGPAALSSRLAALATLVLGAVLVTGALQVRRIECCWSDLRAARVPRDSVELHAALARAVAEARRLAERAAPASLLPQPVAFALLAAAVRSGPGDLERGVVILGRNGEPVAWAGRHRVVPAPDTAELRATITPFYVTLEARRQTQAGGTAVGSVLMDAGPGADRVGAVSAVFARERGVELHLYAPDLAPPGAEAFDYGPKRSPVLFSVEAVPPGQGDVKLAALARTARLATLTLGAVLVLLLMAAPPGRWRWAMLLAAAWAVTRALLGPWLAVPALFSPATFFRSALGVFGNSAGSLTIAGAVLLLAASVLWRRGLSRRWWTVATAALLVLAAPYLVRDLARGIAPPAGGVSLTLWLSWEAALATASMALVLAAAALVRGTAEPDGIPWTLPAACAWAVLAAVAGLWLWSPYGAWPEWYTFLWVPALAGVIVPAPARWALAGIATVAGTAAALLTWGAAVEGRLALADRDASLLGAEGDPLAAAQLHDLGQAALTRPPPRTAGELYGVWLGSPLSGEGYPASLSLWSPAGEPHAELRLAKLDVPASFVSALAGVTRLDRCVRVERLARGPGMQYVLLAPLTSGDVLAVAVGPRSLLVPSDTVARFLRGEQSVEPPYTAILSPPEPGPPAASARVIWHRDRWAARGERRLELADGVHHVHFRVDLQGPWALLVRGALVVVADLALLGAVWLLGMVVTDGWRPRVPAIRTLLRTSYRARLAAALAAFFVLPVLGFAAWSFARLGDEVRGFGDLRIRQTLRDAAAGAGEVPDEPPASVGRSVVELGRRLSAELWLYRGGRLAGVTTSVLAELGLVDPLLAPAAFQRLALEDELEFAADGRTAGRSIRIGYRVVAGGAPGEQSVLAVPQLVDDASVRRQQEDLALALVLATLAGLVAALALAGIAARGLAKPVAALRDAALAVGRGVPPAAFPPGAPREFEPVMSAFERMATDVRQSQAALEEARRRTAQVLANVATGVIAVDEGLRATIANPRAAELLGIELEPGDLLPGAAPPAWLPVWSAVGDFIARGGDQIVEHEFEIAGRQIRVQLAPLGPKPDGCVVALDDATALTRAARILAWGEMARQVAHEIKNPLTPIRLGIQHLQRARRDKENFDATLEDTAGRILAEIDRLDSIARAFSRFGAPAVEQLPLEAVDVVSTAREVVQLYGLGGRGGGGGTRFEIVADGGGGGGSGGGGSALARRDEFKEVLVNLLENARAAGARRVVVRVAAEGREVTVEDDGRGIAADVLPRVFEPTFSTTSSGSGLGLAIAKRLVESWGGSIALSSTPGLGTTVTMRLPGGRDAASGDAAHTPA